MFLLGDSLRGAAGCRMFLQELGDSDAAATSLDLLGEANFSLQAQAGVRILPSGPPLNEPSLCPTPSIP